MFSLKKLARKGLKLKSSAVISNSFEICRGDRVTIEIMFESSTIHCLGVGKFVWTGFISP